MPKKMRKKFKRTKEYSALSDDQSSESSLRDKIKKLKTAIKADKKSKRKVVNSKMTFEKLHNEFGYGIKNNQISEESA